MNKYVPKVGDKVRATLGDTVIVGRVPGTRSIDGALWRVDVAPSEDSFAQLTLEFRHWHFEQVVSVPTKFGAVIRRADGAKSVLLDPASGSIRWISGDLNWSWLSDEEATEGGFTVLFEGVDE